MAVNGDEDGDMVQKHGVKGFPTLRYYPSGMDNTSDYKEYTGERTADGMNKFLEGFTRERRL